jgi:hypothetical protein
MRRKKPFRNTPKQLLQPEGTKRRKSTITNQPCTPEVAPSYKVVWASWIKILEHKSSRSRSHLSIHTSSLVLSLCETRPIIHKTLFYEVLWVKPKIFCFWNVWLFVENAMWLMNMCFGSSGHITFWVYPIFLSR